jgi:receptor protein-tyrosine kinase
MSPTLPRRSHLFERAADAARAAIAADLSHTRAPRLLLAPVETVPSTADAALLRSSLAQEEAPSLTIGVAVPPVHQSQAAGPLRRNDPNPVTGELLRRAGMVDAAGPEREEIALIREQILRSIEATPPADGRQARLVVVTSSRSGEGKSFTALNLAASIAAEAHRPVILVDTQRSTGSLTDLLGLRDAQGLEQLRGTDDPDPAGLLRRTEIPDLFVLPHGAAQHSGARGSAMTDALLHLANRLSDHIIIMDTPACLESSVAGLLATAAGQIALVVEAERTKRAEVEAALDILDACPTLQLLLNRSSLRVSDRFRARGAHASDVAIGVNQA